MWYNQTEVATKEELENVKGMIDVSARLVKTITLHDAETQLVECDYAIISSIEYVLSEGIVVTVYSERIYITPGGSAYKHYTKNNDSSSIRLVLNTNYSLTADSTNVAYPLSGCMAECYKYQ